MDLLGKTYKYWFRERDRAFYRDLINLLLGLNCSVFVGAGLSVHAGYPTFKQLIEYLADQGEIADDSISRIDDLPLRAKEIKKIINENGGNFYDILYRRFDNQHFSLRKTTELLESFIQIPFKSIVTTNYDSCIEEVAKSQGKGFSDDDIQIFPFIKPSNLEARRLYYIHGKIDQGDMAKSSESLILTSDDFEKAYNSEKSTLPNFLSSFLDIHNVVFIGFALEERTLFDILELSKKRKNFLMGYNIDPPENPPTKYALLPVERNKIENVTEEEYRNYLKFLENRDSKIEKEYDVLIIRYYANNGFPEMEDIIKNIYSQIKASLVKVNPDLTQTGVPI